MGRGFAIKRFERLPDGFLKTPMPIWDWVLRESFSNFGWTDQIDWSAVRVHRAMHADHLTTHTRQYQRRDELKRETFEAVPIGAITSYALFITDAPDNLAARRRTNARLPAVAEVGDALEFAGTFLGVSPWGNRFGYGRFEVAGLDVIKTDRMSELKPLLGLDMPPGYPSVERDEDEDEEIISGTEPILE